MIKAREFWKPQAMEAANMFIVKIRNPGVRYLYIHRQGS